MSGASRLLAMLGRLPPAQTHRIVVERGLTATMPDGVKLLADRYCPHGSSGLPIVLIRAPYSRGSWPGLLARLFAERGFQAVIQECRGTGESGGTFNALRNEHDDGLRTLEWLAEQPWFTGSVGMAGLSYLSFNQWAVAADAPAYVKALAIQVCSSEIRSGLYHGESFAFYTALRWGGGMGSRKERPSNPLIAWLRERRGLARAFRQLPLQDADTVATGGRVGFFQDWLEHTEPGDPFWAEVDYSRRLAEVTANVTIVGGWYDILLPRQFADYKALRDAGRDVRLTVGPWHHTQPAGIFAGIRDSLEWFDARLLAKTGGRRTAAVRIFVMGLGKWRDLPDWPPPATLEPWYLHADGRLSPDPSAASAPDRYRYDPADPTPSIGGILLRGDAGQRDDRRLEKRADVLTYTSRVLDRDLEVIGPVTAEVHVRASRPHFDVFVRICDVAPNGKSVNVCDGPLRVSPERHAPGADGVFSLRVDLWPTAYHFKRGHRVRVHVSSGAHPRIARNPGGGEPLASASSLHTVDLEVFHDPTHVSGVFLRVVEPPAARDTRAEG